MNGSESHGSLHASEHLLLTVLGRNPSLACYTLRGSECQATLAPAALIELLPSVERPDRVLALCTPEAREESLQELREALPNGIRVDPVDVAADTPAVGVNDYLQAICDSIPSAPGVELSVDVTHGFRHLSILTYLAALYIAALRRIRLRGAYYGLLRKDGPSPFLDLLPLTELPQWIHALGVLHTTGSTLPIAELLCAKPMDQSTKNIVRDLERFSIGYLSGLPLEVGRQARQIQCHLKPLRKLLKNDHALPRASEVVEHLDETVRRFGISGSNKSEVVLSDKELDRQAGHIDDLLRSQNVASALGLMHEWTVSWVALRLGTGSEWLDHRGPRRDAANLLGAFAAICSDRQLKDRLTPEQCALGEFWAALRDLRNGYHHHGMRRQDMVKDSKVQKGLDGAMEYWSQTLKFRPEFRFTLGEAARQLVLVTPLGKSPGVLSSAIQACRASPGEPDLCLVVCSQESRSTIQAALQHANYANEVESLCLDDPYGGTGEITRMATAARAHLVGAKQVAVNITGGTTLMGLASEEIAVAARRLACPVQRFGLIDRRTPERQATDSYKQGVPFWIGE